MRIEKQQLALFALAVTALFLSACGTTSPTARRSLPRYETPLQKEEFQNVRTTAYTHTESDHRPFSNRNALGGKLQAATGAIRRAEYKPRALPVTSDLESDYRRAMEPVRTTKVVKTKRGKKKVVVVTRPQVGSAAADWSRWPAGTVFRLLSTGQVYKVDDYGWALSGRNTIDLYMPSRSAMNAWGARQETIQVLRWGDQGESLRLLQGHQSHRHIRRMVLELEGNEKAAAKL